MKKENFFKIETIENVDPPVIALHGDITGEFEDHVMDAFEKLSGKVFQAQSKDDSLQKIILIHFGHANYINSSGIGILINMITQATEMNGNIFFVHLPPHLQRVMDMVGLSEYISVEHSADLKKKLST